MPRRNHHPEFPDRTIFDVFQNKRASLITYPARSMPTGRGAGFGVEHMPHSLWQRTIIGERQSDGRRADVCAHACRIVYLAERTRSSPTIRACSGHQMIYDPWHYVPVLIKKPGALRNGAPFKDWALPSALTGFGQAENTEVTATDIVEILSAVLTTAWPRWRPRVPRRSTKAYTGTDVILGRAGPPAQPGPPVSILKPATVSDFARYDRRRPCPPPQHKRRSHGASEILEMIGDSSFTACPLSTMSRRAAVKRRHKTLTSSDCQPDPGRTHPPAGPLDPLSDRGGQVPLPERARHFMFEYADR